MSATTPETGPRRDRQTGSVTTEFDRIGEHYDRLTGMSPGYAAQLRESARTLVGLLPAAGDAQGRPLRVADLGCGSGTSTAALVRVFGESGRSARIEGIDGSAGMLAEAARKEWPDTVTFRRAQADDLGADEGGYDAVFAAYLLRNVDDRDAFLRSVARMLRPGGVLVIHEYGVAGRPLDMAAWTALCWGVIIPSALVVTRRRPDLFTYLWRSVLDFDDDATVRRRLVDAGFTNVGQRPVSGWQRGMVRATWGRRP